MSHLFLATDADVLAAKLLDEIAARQKAADPFEPISIVVPNRFVQQWLRFRIARQWGVAINLQFTFLEQALWDWLRELDPRPHAQPPELLDEERYHLLALSILWNDADPALAPLQAYFEKGTRTISRLGCRRAWQLAGRLGGLIREYEYHRQDAIIHRWLDPEAVVDVPASWREREAAQRAVFRAITHETTGRRAVLNRELKRNFKTLPQYVMEFVHEVKGYLQPPRRAIHLFGLGQISPLHLRALELLGPFHDWSIYHLNPLVSRIGSAPNQEGLQNLAHAFRGEQRPDDRPGTELLQIWGRAGAESLDLTAGFLRDSDVRSIRLPSPKRPAKPATVLTRLQDAILGVETELPPRLPQDVSLQIVRCPGIWREVETIHAGIVNALQRDPSLQQTDIAVLVTDMNLYRPVLTAVFERPPARLSYALADYSAARVSTFGQAVVGMLDLALENLSRTRVFEVLLNPCVLARLKIDRESALHWLTWAANLGIYHGWDSAEKKAQGYAASPLYSWKLGLQRLRLGQFMNVSADDDRGPLAQWQGVIPFADIESGDRDRLDQFCRVVEGLLPMLVRLRGMKASAAEWSEAILSLMQRFLAAPEDRPEEEPVRDALIVSLRRFAEWDLLHGASATALPLALVREYVASRLHDISGRRSDILSSGVTIAALKPQRPVPFEVLFLAGMGEKNFPGGAAPSPFDLRQIRRQAGDILQVELDQFGLLEAILSARQKLIITYNGRELQKDEALQPAIPIAQLRRFVAKSIVADGEFRAVEVPLVAHDPAYLDTDQRPVYQDVLAQDRAVDRLLALDLANQAGRLALVPLEAATVARLRRGFEPEFGVFAAAAPQAAAAATVSLAQLKKFLENPAAAALRYHLRAKEEWTDDDADENNEPLISEKYVGRRLVEQMLQTIVRRAETEDTATVCAEWPEEFAAKYHEWSLRGLLPEGAFAEVDAAVLRDDVESALTDGGLQAFLDTRTGKEWSGPMLVGESPTPIGSKRALPALTLPFARELPGGAADGVRLVGQWPFVWEDDEAVELLVFNACKAEKDKALDRSLFEPLLFAVVLAALGELRQRRAVLYIVRPEGKGIDEAELSGALLEASAARDYLGHLATDFLDRSCADQLPFKIARSSDLRMAYQGDDDPGLAERLLQVWRELEEDRDWGFGKQELVDLQDIGFRVPDDACAKLRRRLGPLHALLTAAAAKAKPRGKKKGGGA